MSARPLLRHATSALRLFAVWTLWLGLGLLLLAQGYVATHHEMAVPRPVLTELERRLSLSGMQADFGRTRFDPTGRVLIEDLRLRFAGYEEPVVTAKVMALRVDPVMLLAGKVDIGDVRISGLSARVPAMLSPSGSADDVIADADIDFVPGRTLWRVRWFSARVGGIPVSGGGDLLLPAPRAGAAPPKSAVPAGLALAQAYAAWTQRAASAFGMLGTLDEPVMRFTLAPLPGAVGRAEFAISAQRVRYSGGTPALPAVSASGIRITGTWPLLPAAGDPLSVRLTAQRVAVSGRGAVAGLDSVFDGVAAPAGAARPVEVRHLRVTARSVAAEGVSLQSPMADADVSLWPVVRGSARALAWRQPVAVGGSVDFARRAADISFQGSLDPAAAPDLDRLSHSGFSPFVCWQQPLMVGGAAHWRAGGAFSGVEADVAGRDIVARTVQIDEMRAHVEFDGRHLRAPSAFARLGGNQASGSFEQDAAGNYRFLLEGRLRPLAISPWIAGSWWTDFFGHFDFRSAPEANMDLRGNWKDGRQAMVFLSVTAAGLGYDRLEFSAVQGRLFARPQFTDVLELSARQGSGLLAGSFSRSYNFAGDAWSQLGIKLTSTVDPQPILGLLGPDAAAALEGIRFESPPAVVFEGAFTGPGNAAGSHRDLHFTAETPADVIFHGIRFSSPSFAARIHDADVAVDAVQARVDGGALKGSAALTGPDARRRLKFEVRLTDLGLSQAIATASGVAGQTHDLIKANAAVRVDAEAAAEGQFGDPYSFVGAGSIDLRGGEIGELHMLGLLSQLLRFTNLRFTSATARFRIDGSQLAFSDINLAGANSAVTARGTCGLEHGDLDIRARLNPFSESHSLPQKFMDVVLTPLSEALEVRLIGTVRKPRWVFVNGPGNFARPPVPAAAPTPPK